MQDEAKITQMGRSHCICLWHTHEAIGTMTVLSALPEVAIPMACITDHRRLMKY
jgi:hypothetical protein